MTSQAIIGRVLRAVGGFYSVVLPDGGIADCRIAGRLKLRGTGGKRGSVLVGDLALLEQAGDMYLLHDVLPRTTELVRPAVANVDLCVVVQSIANPAPNLDLTDRILVQAAQSRLECVICLSKADLADAQEAEKLRSLYESAGYRCVVTCSTEGIGLSELVEILKDRVSTLAGPSGVGKSRLLNAICPAFQRETGSISTKAERGRHTTRQVQLLPLPQGGWVADTPGFSTLDLGGLAAAELPLLYPDFAEVASRCRFSNCLHRDEPDCAVGVAVSERSIDAGRYQRYLRFLREIEQHEAYRY